MQNLELKIPPPLVMLLSCVLAFLLSGRSVDFLMAQLSLGSVLWPLFFVFIGIAIAVSGVREFSRHQTTTNPLDPNMSTTVVNTGIFRFTRNPMYLGMVLLLVGWGDYLDNFLGFGGALFFILYITRLQIMPEERILLANFSEAYKEYMQTVRRWL